jgi:kumamolisin
VPVSLVVLLACCAAAVPVGAAAGASAPTVLPMAAATSEAAALLPTSFAERAGYSATAPLEVTGTASPLQGLVNVEVTFEPSNPALYDVPVSGTAPMTAAQVADAYGLSVPAYAAAEQYFEQQGLSVSHSWPDRLSLSLSGPAAAVDQAFGTSVRSGSYDGRAVTFPDAPPSLPASLESEVQAVSGLSTGFDLFSLPAMPEPIRAAGSSAPSQAPTDLVTPSIARAIYDVSGLYNLTSSPTYSTGKGIVLLLWGNGYWPLDIQTFFSQYYPSGFPAPTVAAYPVDGAPQPSASSVNDPSNGSRELTLDLEWSGSMAPGATLDAVYAPAGPSSDEYSPTDASMIDALNLAVDSSSIPDVAAISMSFGAADGGDPTLTSGFENDFAVAAHEGITLFAATGDNGGDAAYSPTTGCSGGPQPDYPSASPQVVAVGGTSVSLNRNALGTITGFSEAAWPGSGGGFSKQFSAPSWQEVGSAAAPIEAAGHRGMPDVAATADTNFLYFDGQSASAGGTSFATPLWAGMVVEMDALRGSDFGFLTPALYALGANTSVTDAPFHDITSGGNCLGSAEPGWGSATGWGSPDGVFLYEHLVASFVNLSLVATPSPVAPGGTVTVDVTVTNATSGAPIAGVSVVVALSSAGIGGPCSGSFGSAAPVSNGAGAVVATISVPYCYLGSSAVVTATVTGGGYYGVGSASVRVNLIGFYPALAPLSQYPDNVAFFVAIMSVAIIGAGYLGRRRDGPGTVAPPPMTPPPVTVPPSPPAPPTVPGEPNPAESSTVPAESSDPPPMPP